MDGKEITSPIDWELDKKVDCITKELKELKPKIYEIDEIKSKINAIYEMKPKIDAIYEIMPKIDTIYDNMIKNREKIALKEGDIEEEHSIKKSKDK